MGNTIPVFVSDCSICPFMIDGFDKYYCHLDVNKSFPDLCTYIMNKLIPQECPLIKLSATVSLIEPVKRNIIGGNRQ